MEAENATSNEKNSTGDTESRETSTSRSRCWTRSEKSGRHPSSCCRWGESVSKLVPALPDMPTPPTFAGLPTPATSPISSSTSLKH